MKKLLTTLILLSLTLNFVGCNKKDAATDSKTDTKKQTEEKKAPSKESEKPNEDVVKDTEPATTETLTEEEKIKAAESLILTNVKFNFDSPVALKYAPTSSVSENLSKHFSEYYIFIPNVTDKEGNIINLQISYGVKKDTTEIYEFKVNENNEFDIVLYSN